MIAVFAYGIDKGTLFFGIYIRSHRAILNAHAARIWNVRVHEDFLVSVGEDAACHVWSISQGTRLASWKGHEGRHVWSVAIDPTGRWVVCFI